MKGNLKYLTFKKADELKQVLSQKEGNLEKFCEKNRLKTNEQIKQFLKMRFSIILKSYEQQKKLLQQPPSESNIPFSKTKHFLLEF